MLGKRLPPLNGLWRSIRGAAGAEYGASVPDERICGTSAAARDVTDPEAQTPCSSAMTSARLFTGARDTDGHFHAAGLDAVMAEKLGLSVPLRLHAVVPAPGGGAVAIARRPGDLAFVLGKPGEPLVLRAAAGRCFAGHGVFFDHGRKFAIAEIDAETADGHIGVLDVEAGFARIADYPTAGVGPHELVRIEGGMVVANGAREPNTDPTLRALLTTAARSNIAVLGEGGQVRSVLEAGADFTGLSLRHMAGVDAGMVVVAAQESEPGIADRPLLFTARDERLEPVEADERVWLSLKGYVGSVAVDASKRFALISSPRGNIAWAFDIHRRRAVGSVHLADVCGIAADGRSGGFIATTGLGTVARLAATEDALGVVEQRTVAVAFDNHLFG
jgi:uncharacterized protein